MNAIDLYNPSAISLRRYQKEAEDKVFVEWEDVCSTLVVLPTGGGKTILFASAIKRRGGRAIVIAHREELIFQAKDKIQRTTGLNCEIEMGQYVASNNCDVVIATVQTLNSAGRLKRFDPLDFDTLIIDEAHHGVADTYTIVIDYFRQNPSLRILCVTATPDRADEEALGQICETVAENIEILDLIKQGWLVDVHQRMITIENLDFSHVRTTAGDLNGADLAKVMEVEEICQGVVGATIDAIEDRKTIVFTSSVRQAEIMSEIFNRHRYGMASWICGKTPKDVRRERLDKFSGDETQVMVNCGVLTEGYDNPRVECIGMAKPTKSRALYSQMLGRGTRPLPGLVDSLDSEDERVQAILASAKPRCMVLDYVGNSGRHKLVTGIDILGGKVSDEVIELAEAKARASGKLVCITEALLDAEEELKRQQEERRRAEEARKARLVAKVSYSSVEVSPFDIFHITPVKARGWDNGKQLSEKQRAVLRSNDIDPDKYPFSHSKQLLVQIFDRKSKNLCRFKQARLLKKFGYDATDMSFHDASSLITRIKENGWRRPPDTVRAVENTVES